MDFIFEEVKESHIPHILTIYNCYVKNSFSTLHDYEIGIDEMRNILFFTNPKHKSFSIIYQNKIIGYVLLARYKNHKAYDNTAEVSIYLHPDYRHLGIGKSALYFIENYARNNNFHVIIATICSSNIDSIRLFESSGYKKCAHFVEVAKKFGKFIDIVNYQKIL